VTNTSFIDCCAELMRDRVSNLWRLAMVLCIDMNEASAKSSRAYFLKARAIYSLLGMKDELRGIEPCINMAKAKVQLAMFGGGRNTFSASDLLQNVVSKRDLNAKSEYERNKVSLFGLTSEKTMEAGFGTLERL